MQKPRLLLIDPDPQSRNAHQEILAQDNYALDLAADFSQALSLLAGGSYAIIITEILSPQADELEWVRRIKNRNPTQEIVILTERPSIDSAIGALQIGVSEYLRKPVNPEEFRIAIKRILEKQSLFLESDQLQQTVQILTTCNRLSGCLDLDDLSQMTLDVLLSAFRSSAGVFFSYDEKKAIFTSKYSRNLGLSLERALIEYLNGLHKEQPQWAEKLSLLQPLHDFPRGGGTNPFRSLVLLPIRAQGQLTAACAVCHLKNEAAPTLAELDRFEVVAKQIDLAFANSIKLKNAKDLAFIDELTGCYNTRYLDFFVDKEIKRAKRQGYPISFLFLDLDYFKTVNDSHGHLVGSRVLIEVTKILGQCTRDTDVIVRYGGDEYVLILIDTDSAGARQVAERIRQSIVDYPFAKEQGLNLHISASLGIASFPEHAKDKRDVLNLADKAMYHVKSTTRNSVYIASAEIMNRPLKPH